MSKKIYCLFVLIVAVSCNTSPDTELTNKRFDGSANNSANIYRLHLNPADNSKYYYQITNESTIHIETHQKEIDQLTRTTAGVFYDIKKDTSGNYILRMTYDKIKLHTKNGDQESDMDAANAAHSLNPVEKMLGILKEASISATLSPKGEMKSVSGYNELTEKVLAPFRTADLNTREMARNRWQQLIEEGVMKKSMENLFQLFPDSAMRIGDKWTMHSTQKGEISMKVTTTYTLESIRKGIATVTTESTLTRDPSSTYVMGMPVTGDLNGHQTGESQIDIKTGMLIKSTINANIRGDLEVMGREVPIRIKNTVTMHGKKVN